MVWNATDLMGVTIAAVDAAAAFPLGMKVSARNTADGFMGEFIYMKGVASTAVGSWVSLNYDDGSTTLLEDGAIGPAGVAMAAVIASTYGWYQVAGKAEASLLASTGDNAGLYAQVTSSAGAAGVTGVGLSEIIGARAAEATTSSAAVAEVEINYPVVGLSHG
jgi:hypothetical protein